MVSPAGGEDNKPLSVEEHREDSDDEEEERPRKRGFFRAAIGIIGSILKSIWRGVVWLFKTETNPRAGLAAQNPDRDFNHRFQTQVAASLARENVNPVAFYEGDSFFSLCEVARARKKPILAVMLRDKQSLTQHRMLYQALMSSEHIKQHIQEDYLVYGVYYEQVNPETPSLQLTDDQELIRVLRLPSRATVSLWVVIVQHDQNLQVNSRLAGRSPGDFSTSRVNDFLSENLSLFSILAEEDPEYQRQLLLPECNPASSSSRYSIPSPFTSQHSLQPIPGRDPPPERAAAAGARGGAADRQP